MSIAWFGHGSRHARTRSADNQAVVQRCSVLDDESVAGALLHHAYDDAGREGHNTECRRCPQGSDEAGRRCKESA